MDKAIKIKRIEDIKEPDPADPRSVDRFIEELETFLTHFELKPDSKEGKALLKLLKKVTQKLGQKVRVQYAVKLPTRKGSVRQAAPKEKPMQKRDMTVDEAERVLREHARKQANQGIVDRSQEMGVKAQDRTAVYTEGAMRGQQKPNLLPGQIAPLLPPSIIPSLPAATKTQEQRELEKIETELKVAKTKEELRAFNDSLKKVQSARDVVKGYQAELKTLGIDPNLSTVRLGTDLKKVAKILYAFQNGSLSPESARNQILTLYPKSAVATAEPKVEAPEPKIEAKPAAPEPKVEAKPASPEPKVEAKPAAPEPKVEAKPAAPELRFPAVRLTRRPQMDEYNDRIERANYILTEYRKDRPEIKQLGIPKLQRPRDTINVQIIDNLQQFEDDVSKADDNLKQIAEKYDRQKRLDQAKGELADSEAEIDSAFDKRGQAMRDVLQALRDVARADDADTRELDEMEEEIIEE